MDITTIKSISERIANVGNEKLNEAMTKNTLVLPFLQALGYDVFDHNEVAPEYTSDYGTKVGEKIDFAILQEGYPIILIECKPLGTKLDEGKCSQLFRYFSTHPETRIGILTDGCHYLFFADLEKENVMDKKPFMDIDLSDFNERYLPQLKKLAKNFLDINSVLSKGKTFKYIRQIKKCFAEDMNNPSDELIKYYVSKVYDKRMTAKAKEQFQEIVKRALVEYIDDKIDERLEKAINAGKQQEIVEDVDAQPQEESNDSDIVTTGEEISGFCIVQAIVSEQIKPSRATMRDAKSYCAILLDDNNRKPICRLFLGGQKPSIVLFDKEEIERIYLDCLEDIYLYAQRLRDTVINYDKQN